jgi:TonB family protein
MKARHIEGWVILRFVVDASGMVIGPSIAVDTATNPAFIPPAKEAVTRTQFAPATHSGRPVAVCVQQTINFSIS